MSIHSEKWPAGTPTWADLGADDPAAAQAFYTGLFGWEYLSGGEDAGGYVLAHIGGKAVAGLGPKQDPAIPTVWTSYLASDDVDATAEQVTAAGGQLVAPPFDVMDSGRMAVVTDNVGAVFGIWQAGTHIGAERVNEHGSMCWNELHTSDYDKAQSFYTDVFGFSYRDVSAEGFVYSTFRRGSDSREVGGILHDTDLPEGVPAYWLAWFASDNVEATAAKAQELGAALLMPAMDSAFGRMAIVQGPQREVFGIIDAPRTTN